MACANGAFHTITVSNDGVVHSFGQNDEGQLGLGHNNNVSLPTPIPNLSQIKQVSCGYKFTVCVDYDGYMWSFGGNKGGQLGTGNTIKFNVPQKIPNIPPVFSVSCGKDHILAIANDDSTLWSCGNNMYGQLCLGNKKNQSTFQKTAFSNISKVSSGNHYSLFQNNKGEIYVCGHNYYGGLGLGHFDSPQITPTCIPNLPANIIEFVCGISHNLFLDAEGNVFAVGYGYYGQLGLDQSASLSLLNQIENIPPIRTISCTSCSSYLIDFEGNVWNFGSNLGAQLGHGDKKNRYVPTKIEFLKDIQQISYGCCGYGHYLVKDSQGNIFAIGNNSNGQLGTGDTKLLSTPKKISSKYFSIWGECQIASRAKSARK